MAAACGGSHGQLYFVARRRLGADAPRDRAGSPTTAQQRQIEQERQRLLDELGQMTREVGQQLDKRAARLEQLIKEAQKTIESLESATARPGRAGQGGAAARNPITRAQGD